MSFLNLHEIEERDFNRGPVLWDADPDVCCAAFQLGACIHTESFDPEEEFATELDFYTGGRLAFRAGLVRIVPRDILVDHGVEAAREWYQGWDSANLSAPVPGIDGDDEEPF